MAIARVLAGDPKLILADEPTGNLDSLMTREIMDLLERINEQGTTIVMVTHSPECAARAHRQIHLLDGKVVDLDARADACAARPSSRRVALGAAMLLYNLRIACKSLRRNPILSVVIVGGIALGIAVATMFSTVRHAFAKDPIPEKSDVLHYVRLDTGTRGRPYPGDEATRPPHADHLPRHGRDHEVATSRCARAGCSRRTSTSSRSRASGRPDAARSRGCASPTSSPCSTCRSSTARAGTSAADAGPEPVVVLDEETNDQLFGGAEQRRQDGAHRGPRLQVVGVLDAWRPTVKFYDITQQAVAAARSSVFMPFNFVRPMEIRTAGNSDGWKSAAGARVRGPAHLRDDLDPDVGGAARRERACSATRTSSTPTSREQKKLGRFPRPLTTGDAAASSWLKEQKVTPREVTAMLMVSLLFLAVARST